MTWAQSTHGRYSVAVSRTAEAIMSTWNHDVGLRLTLTCTQSFGPVSPCSIPHGAELPKPGGLSCSTFLRMSQKLLNLDFLRQRNLRTT